ncbi:MAG: DNA mismatch repair protein MutS [Pyrinomonadaceae bacterium MAG19_C2-C3]|nr:DNA mismatch repair protein MutS [Pyrinomonadaceae bacterium MAG19_C2-C3]
MNTPLTPLRRQYLDIKRDHPDCLLLFRIGDFYESFDSDAATLARELDIVLTSKPMGRIGRIPLAGIPHHTLERHLATLIGRGYRVAICEQLTEAGKGLIERGVVRIVTPGTVLEPALLSSKANNYLVAVHTEGKRAGLAYADVTTGEFAATEVDRANLVAELHRIGASEILIARNAALDLMDAPGTRTFVHDENFQTAHARQVLLRHFQVRTLAAFNLNAYPLAMPCAAAIIGYLSETQVDVAANLTRLAVYNAGEFMMLDAHTLRSLDVFETGQREAGKPDAPTLLAVIDRTRTAMGGRLLRRFLRRPSLDAGEIARRQNHVKWFVAHLEERRTLQALLEQIHDLERLSSRTRARLATAHELWTLGQSLKHLPIVRRVLQADVKALGTLLAQLPACDEACELIARGLSDDLTKRATGGVIREGFSEELDTLRALLRDGKRTLAEMEARERARTGIRSLRVGYNKVFGYYIEVTKPNIALAPADYTRKQTLANAERFITLELKEHEALVTNARERIEELEATLFRHLCEQVGSRRAEIAGAAATLSYLDVMMAFAEVAEDNNYTCPNIKDDGALHLKAVRHPVIERHLEGGVFIANDCHIGGKGDSQIMLLTGPNMSGKSTYMRAVALSVLLAHTGSFVPASEAEISLCDRIWTRTGLYDRIGLGESTFMTEMIETAEILHGATMRSLVLLDELGRGTSTYDGLAIARAVLEYIHNHPRLRMKTLFATHYHELTVLETVLPRVANFHVAIAEHDDEIDFLYQVIPGAATKSYGIHAARLAGLPRPVIRRAQSLLDELEMASVGHEANAPIPLVRPANSTDEGDAGLVESIIAIDLDEVSPIEALTKLYELRRQAQDAVKHRQDTHSKTMRRA